MHANIDTVAFCVNQIIEDLARTNVSNQRMKSLERNLRTSNYISLAQSQLERSPRRVVFED